MSSSASVLVVEDNSEIGSTLVRGLRENEFEVRWEKTAAGALESAQARPPDVVILDRMLPDGEGLEVLARLREHGVRTRSIVLSALTSVEDRVRGLNEGADDYLAKPFAFAELLARIYALLRRSAAPQNVFKVADLVVDLHSRQVERGGERIELSSTLFALLEYLLKHAGQVVTRKMILDDIWHSGVENVTNVVDVYINRLRNKIDKGSDRPLIHTVRGLGYVLEDR